MNKNPMCNGSHCAASTGEVRVLPYSWSKDGTVMGNLILCRACWHHEMTYRKKEHPDMPRPEWNTLEIYTGA